MIFVLILAALAAVYYITPPKPKRDAARRDAMLDESGVLTPGLVALGRALDQYGRGQEPRPGGDGVGEEVRKTERDRL